ncbi:MAG TPA: nucleotidyltransferase domain-containing protein [Anaerolineae bacterium]|nr:nucleotidyltransferase domain-containing protein [Anaerolineae bacterium]
MITRSFIFKPEDRQYVLDHLLQQLVTDQQITGTLLVGSTATGFTDNFSDIDLIVVMPHAATVTMVYDQWHQKIQDLFPVLQSYTITHDEDNLTYSCLLENYIEINITFLYLDALIATRSIWQITFDRSGKIADIMTKTWADQSRPDSEQKYLDHIRTVWYDIMHVIIFVHREQPWRAHYHLQQLQHLTIKLAGLRYDLHIHQGRHADEIPTDIRSSFDHMLATNSQSDEILRALRYTTTLFFEQAHALETKFGRRHAPLQHLHNKMIAYLTIFAPPQPANQT